jgi:hypothetical protein
MGRTLSSLKSDEATLTSVLEEKQNMINHLNRDLEELKAKKERVNKQVRKLTDDAVVAEAKISCNKEMIVHSYSSYIHTDTQISKGVEIEAESVGPHPPRGGEGHRAERDERFQQLCDPATWQQSSQQARHDVHPTAAVLSGGASPSPLTHGQ